MKHIAILTAYLFVTINLHAQSDQLSASFAGDIEKDNNVSFASFSLVDASSINFLDFSALRSKQKVKLNWVTTNECNTVGFHIQRSTAGLWKSIAFIPAKGRKSNSQAATIYNYSETNIYNFAEYKIVEVDKWGNEHATISLEVSEQKQKAPLVVYQGGNGNIHLLVQAEGDKDLKVFDLTGKLVKEVNKFTNNSLELRDIKRGVFSLQVYAYQTSSVAVAKINVR